MQLLLLLLLAESLTPHVVTIWALCWSTHVQNRPMTDEALRAVCLRRERKRERERSRLTGTLTML